MIVESLIIDVGLHDGGDADFYLHKGFDVVGVEANPALVARCRARFAAEIAAGRLTIVDRAIAEREGEVTLYVDDTHDDWGTTTPRFAEHKLSYGSSHTTMTVAAIRFASVLEQHGIPYYLKVDIEGADLLCMEALRGFESRPRFVSIEADQGSYEDAFSGFATLWGLGYRGFKIVNQSSNWKVRCPMPAVEGDFVDWRFDGTTSGPFGEEAPGEWLGLEQAMRSFERRLKEHRWFGKGSWICGTPLHRAYEVVRGEQVGYNAWFDIHAKHGSR